MSLEIYQRLMDGNAAVTRFRRNLGLGRMLFRHPAVGRGQAGRGRGRVPQGAGHLPEAWWTMIPRVADYPRHSGGLPPEPRRPTVAGRQAGGGGDRVPQGASAQREADGREPIARPI